MDRAITASTGACGTLITSNVASASVMLCATVSAVRYNPHLKSFYTRLVEENHRPTKVALTAVMRKLLIAANSAVKNPDFGVVV